MSTLEERVAALERQWREAEYEKRMDARFPTNEVRAAERAVIAAADACKDAPSYMGAERDRLDAAVESLRHARAQSGDGNTEQGEADEVAQTRRATLKAQAPQRVVAGSNPAPEASPAPLAASGLPSRAEWPTRCELAAASLAEWRSFSGFNEWRQADACLALFEPVRADLERRIEDLSADRDSRKAERDHFWTLAREAQAALAAAQKERDEARKQRDIAINAYKEAEKRLTQPDRPEPEAPAQSAPAPAQDAVETCGCRTCRVQSPTEYEKTCGLPMILCKECGNKRCPHATDHRLACTRSNEPGQWGSVYGDPIIASPAPRRVTVTASMLRDCLRFHDNAGPRIANAEKTAAALTARLNAAATEAGTSNQTKENPNVQ